MHTHEAGDARFLCDWQLLMCKNRRALHYLQAACAWSVPEVPGNA